jgi:hypothetical protein
MINKQAERGKFIKINTVYGVRWAIVSARQALDGQVNCPTWRYLDGIGRLKGADINTPKNTKLLECEIQMK